MALTTSQDNINRSILKFLNKDLRYRCLILQSNYLSILDTISKNFEYVSNQFGANYYCLKYLELFDEIGAKSCSDVIDVTKKKSNNSLLLLEGPLHFITFWSNNSQSRFWGFLSTLARGPGVVILDVVRNSIFEEDFDAIGKSTCGRVLFWKSRLSIMETRAL